MKKLIYLLALIVTGLLSSCHDITVGYLIVDETAGYPNDTMIVITKAGKRVTKVQKRGSFILFGKPRNTR